MQPERGPGQSLVALTRAAATMDDRLLEEALPLLRDIACADAALVVTRSAAEGLVRRGADGLTLPIDGVALPATRDELVELAVPADWSATGIRSALAQLLPGHTGVLVLAWANAAPAERVTIEAAMAALYGGLARLEAEERLVDLVQRVDNAGHLALAERETERAAERFRGLVESSPEAILVLDDQSNVLQANGKATELLRADPMGHALDEILPGDSFTGGQGIEARAFDGDALLLDITTAKLTETTDEGHTAVFLKDASPRLDREAMAVRLGESQQRRKQALEINDNVVQGLTSAVYSLEHEDIRQASSYIERTLAAARDIMDDLLEPSGDELHPGDLVRSSPARLDELSPDSDAAHPGSRPDGRSAHRVLIVDDAEDIRALLRLRLNRQDNIEVVGEAADGLDAVDQARKLQPNLVLLDMAMPRMDGLQALPLIREAVPDVHVIVLSGFNQGTLEQEALAAGADRYVVKGGSMTDLLKLIEKVLEVA